MLEVAKALGGLRTSWTRAQVSASGGSWWGSYARMLFLGSDQDQDHDK